MYDPDNQCGDCHSWATGMVDIPRNEEQETRCKTCHNPTGQASEPHLTAVANHIVNGGTTVIDCGSCHNPHMPVVCTDSHPGGQTALNLNLIRPDTTRYVTGALTPAIFQVEPDHFSFDAYPFNGICQTCHTLTDHHRNDGTDPLHHQDEDCTTCHKHEDGFMHGGGGNCSDCHGYTGSHIIHTTGDPRGPAVPLECNACHDSDNFFLFGPTGAGVTLTETDVCDNCHSPNGTFDGVDDPVIGAKNNWSDGIYNGADLRTGKEKWCATCHDEEPGNSHADGTGIAANNIVGDSGAFTYGTGWGYYLSGHGLGSGSTYPASGGVSGGAALNCLECHDSTLNHIDDVSRTFSCADGCDPPEYQLSYRLKQVAGEDPMQIPLPEGGPNSADQFRLCYRCHDTGPYLESTNLQTNLRTDGVNRHQSHLNMRWTLYPADYDFSGENNSRTTCVTCHNVHGSTRLAMVRDGSLIDREPGMRIWYLNDDAVDYETNNPDPPVPENLLLPASTGTIWIPNTSTNLCSHCHANGNTVPEYRDPFQDVEQDPVLEWTGETSHYMTDGINPDSAPGGTHFDFRVLYQDGNNDAPVRIEVWVDVDDDGNFDDPGEHQEMVESDPGDSIYVDGKVYKYTWPLSNAGDGILNYRFYGFDGISDATGPPTMENQITITNNIPTLAWSGEFYFSTDGVHPNTGGDGSLFEFRVEYTDLDDQPPAIIQVWIDEDDDGLDEPGEWYPLIETDTGDLVYSDGKIYSISTAIAFAGDGDLNYRFYAFDGDDDATGDPTSDMIFTVSPFTNTIPWLDWEPGDCRTDGVTPVLGAADAEYHFLIRYTDMDNELPPTASDIQVWIDENDNGTVDTGEMYDLTEVDTGDLDCTDGKLYELTILIGFDGDGILDYRFYAHDGNHAAGGDPTFDHTLTVIECLKVRPEGGSGWFSSIQSAIDSVTDETIVLVYDGTYYENLTLNQNDDLTTIQSVCGPENTAISGTGICVYIDLNAGFVLDGFTVTTDTGTGLHIRSYDPTLSNCIITGNDAGTGNGGGMYTHAGANVTLINTTFSGNTASNGGGIYMNTGSNISFDNCTITMNHATTIGGGIYLNSVGAATIMENSTVSDNTATGISGGLHFNNCSPIIRETIICDNVSDSGGGALFTNGGADPELINCIIAGNQGTQGGAVYGNTGTAPIFTNCTFYENTATDLGGVFYVNSATLIARNSIFWGNLSGNGGHVSHTRGIPLTIEDSIVVQGSSYFTGSVGVVFQGYISEIDPDLDDTRHLKPGSESAIDHGNAAYAPDWDIDGDVRPQGTADDIGADEYLDSGDKNSTHDENHSPDKTEITIPSTSVPGMLVMLLGLGFCIAIRVKRSRFN